MQNKWIWGGGIGCGALIVLLGLAGAGIAMHGAAIKNKAVSAISGELRSHFEQRKKEGKVKPELQEPIAELLTLVQRPETPLVTSGTVIGIVSAILETESVGVELALPALNDFRNLLKAKAAPTMDEIADVCDKHDALMQALDQGPAGARKAPDAAQPKPAPAR